MKKTVEDLFSNNMMVKTSTESALYTASQNIVPDLVTVDELPALMITGCSSSLIAPDPRQRFLQARAFYLAIDIDISDHYPKNANMEKIDFQIYVSCIGSKQRGSWES